MPHDFRKVDMCDNKRNENLCSQWFFVLSLTNGSRQNKNHFPCFIHASTVVLCVWWRWLQ